MSKTLQDILNGTNKGLIDFLRDEIFYVLKKTGLNRKIFIAWFNSILNEVEKRMEVECEGCYANYESEEGSFCIASMCVKKYDYDPETRTYSKK